MPREYGFSLEYSSSEDFVARRENVILTPSDKLIAVNEYIAENWMYYSKSSESVFRDIYFDGGGHLAGIGSMEVGEEMRYYTKLVAPTEQVLWDLVMGFDLTFDNRKFVRGK